MLKCPNVYLHLGSPVLEPKLDLPWLQAQFLTQFHPLLIIWVWTFLKQTAKIETKK